MSIYEEVEIEDLDYDPATQIYTYPCPCGDKFSISLEELYDGEDVATCPSCTLRIEIIYEEDDLPDLFESDDEDEEEEGGADETDQGAKKEDEKKEKDDAGQEEKKEDDDDDDELANSAQKKLAI